jgi:molybdate transport system substrate-binding protein
MTTPHTGMRLGELRRRLAGNVLLILVLGMGLSACAMGQGGGTPDGEITVFAASSLTNAFTDIARAYEARNPHVKVVTNFAASSQLATQLIEGASADVYASADQRQMEQAAQAGRIEGQPVLFATNHLVIIVPAENPAHIEQVRDLALPGVKLILAAPDVPVRVYTDLALKALAGRPEYGSAFADAVYANLASEEQNVRQVSAKVALGEADAGIVYTSDVTPDIASRVKEIGVPDWANPLVEYPIAIVASAPHRPAGQSFIDFVVSEDGQSILTHWGFGHAP